MLDNLLQELINRFTNFPGIGPRQARRFVYFLLSQTEGERVELATLISNLQNAVHQCPSCWRFFPARNNNANLCDLCRDENRDHTTLMLVEKDIDLENIKKLGVYDGNYFVLGGLVPILDRTPSEKIRLTPLLERISKEPALKEIIIALGVTAEGDHTAEFLKQQLEPIATKRQLKLSLLGRGLSTGTELEYSDADTLKNALRHRE